MLSSADIRMSDEVRVVLGAEGVQRVLTASLDQERCPVCGDKVLGRGPVNVVISVSGKAHLVNYCHGDCAPLALLRGDFSLRDVLPDEADMRMIALLLPHGSTLLPVLVAERPVQAWVAFRENAELTDVLVSVSLGHGFVLITRLRDAPRAMLPAPGVLTYNTHGLSDLLIEPTAGDLLYEGTVNIPAGWRGEAIRYGWCVLSSGSGLSDPATEDISVQTLKAAAAAGTLTGTRMRLSWAEAQPAI